MSESGYELGYVDPEVVKERTLKHAARMLEAEHEKRFGGLCDNRDLATREDGPETVIYCENCRFVVARAVLGDDEGNGGAE